MNNLNSDGKNDINENNENSVDNENQTPPVFHSNDSDSVSENCNNTTEKPDNQQSDMNTNSFTSQNVNSDQTYSNQPYERNSQNNYRYNNYNSSYNYARYNGNNYQPPKYNSFYGNKNQENIPPYQDPKNSYHSGKNGGDNFQPQNNDTYKWNLDDYKAPTENADIPKRKKSKGLYVFLSMVAIVIGISVIGLAGYGIYALSIGETTIGETTQSDSASTSQDTIMPNVSIKNKPEVSDSSSSDGTLSSVEIAKKVKPSVVGIQSYAATGFGVQSEGSGIIMSADGYIITNAHVVDGSEGIKVILDNDEAFSAKVIGLDVQSDIAVIKVDAENLTYADFGNSDQLEVGERVLAIGNPSGMELAGSVTQGIISAINRNLKTDGGYTMKFIQVDAAINPGNSGGALVNEYGQVVGINSSKIAATAYEGIGFAIPMNEAMEIVNDLIANGRVTGRAMLGFQGIQVDSVDTSRYGIPLGISIQKINEDSDLNNRNILPGDIITKLDNVDIIDFSDIRTVLANHKPGDFVEMVIFRKNNASAKGQYITVPVKLVEANVEKKAVN